MMYCLAVRDVHYTSEVTNIIFYFFQLEDQKCATGVDITLQESSSDFSAVLDEMCDLLSFYDMISKVSESEGKDLVKLLKQNIIDACEWVSIELILWNLLTYNTVLEPNNYCFNAASPLHLQTKHIATTTPHATYSGELNCDSPDFLRKRCIATRAERGTWLHAKLSAAYDKSNDFVDTVLNGDHIENADEETWIGHFIDGSAPLTCSS